MGEKGQEEKEKEKGSHSLDMMGVRNMAMQCLKHMLPTFFHQPTISNLISKAEVLYELGA